MNLINKIIRIKKKYTLTEIFLIIIQGYIFDIVRMEKVATYIHEMRFVLDEIPYTIEIYKVGEYDEILQSNPYLTKDDIDSLSSSKSFCAVAKDKGKIIASHWFISDTDYFLNEGKQIIHIKDNEYYGLRAFTHEDYRGKNLQNHLVLKCMEYIESPDAITWGLVYSWNISQKKSLARNGYHHVGNMIFIMLFGIKFQYLSSTS